MAAVLQHSPPPAMPSQVPVSIVAPAKKIRVLCLHGHRTNAKVMINQTKGLRAALRERAEFIYVDAPHLARGPTEAVVEKHHGKDAPFFEWWDNRPADIGDEVGTPWRWVLEHHEETLEYMARKLEELGSFDIVVGFSQGAVLLSTLSMLYLQKYNKRLWKLCVCVGGVHVRAVQFRHLFETPDRRPLLVPFPSIHIIGKTDPLYESSVLLSEMYDPHCAAFPSSPLRKMVVFHDGGHKFPSANKYKELYDELAHIILDHCSACDQGSAPTSLSRL